MKIVKNHLPLSINTIKEKIETPYVTLIISPALEFTARSIFDFFAQEVLIVKKDGKQISVKEAIKLKLFEFKVIVETKLNEKEWILITEKKIYYSKGNGTDLKI